MFLYRAKSTSLYKSLRYYFAVLETQIGFVDLPQAEETSPVSQKF